MNARKAKKSPEDMRYSEAMTELEQILEDLEEDNIDVDDLGENVKRASALISHCRLRLKHSKEEIEQVVADLDAFDEDRDEGDVS